MDESFSKVVNSSKEITTLPKRMVVKEKAWDSYYNHFTLRITSLTEYIDVITRISKICDDTVFEPLVFRGHSDASSKYKLIPTIARKDSHLELCENNMVSEMLTLRPGEFDMIKSDFDLLSKMQHFGLPSRLLDFTYNPLIALYFACCDKKKTDSRVICTYDTSDASTMGTIEKICGMYRYTDYNAASLDRIIGGVSQITKYRIDTIAPLMAKPKYVNDRIKHQSAVFMVFPNTVYDLRSQMVIEGKKIGDEHEYQKFPLTAEEKKRLEYVRNEPDFYNGNYSVNTNTLKKLFQYYYKLFPDFFEEAEYTIKPIYHFLLHNRFSIQNSIQELSENQISNSFISILIEEENRDKIIQELAMIGIDKSFVFPELEYTAEIVKNKYF